MVGQRGPPYPFSAAVAHRVAANARTTTMLLGGGPLDLQNSCGVSRGGSDSARVDAARDSRSPRPRTEGCLHGHRGTRTRRGSELAGQGHSVTRFSTISRTWATVRTI
jgi:hypothetical protein